MNADMSVHPGIDYDDIWRKLSLKFSKKILHYFFHALCMYTKHITIVIIAIHFI